LVKGRLHHPDKDHCDDHGAVTHALPALKRLAAGADQNIVVWQLRRVATVIVELRGSPTHPIALKLRPRRARSGGRRRGLLCGLLLWRRFHGEAARQQRRRENQHAKRFNHNGLTSSAIVRHLAVEGQGGS
jgi:hypothetical protein